MGEYNPAEIEPKWQKYWETHKTFKLSAAGKKKLYVLDMFPYPSGAGLHIGHPLGYSATDIYSRFKRMQGFSVLHPMGYDAFGLPAEQHAIKTGEHPGKITEESCRRFTEQMKALGLSYDWDRELATCTVDYYTWTQWIFLKIYDSWYDDKQQKARPISELPIPAEIKKQGEKAVLDYQANFRLAYMDDAMVNWCPELGTVLANEEVINGKSERGGFDVVRKPMRQWILRITKYADRLIDDLTTLDWPESIKEQQRNWIGKKYGTEIDFKIHGTDDTITAFTTRPDTLFGVTYFVLSPEHPLLGKIIAPDHRKKVEDYIDKAAKLSELARTIENREKTGEFTGGYVVNPISHELVPVYVGDYVLMSVGTGAVMGVPAHDERDFEFARKFQLEIKAVLGPDADDKELKEEIAEGEFAWTAPGQMLPCDSPVAKELGLEGKPNKEAAKLINGWLEKHKSGRVVVNYKLRDWLFSRQRYWGEPIPVIHWDDGTRTALSESELPLKLPQVDDYLPSDGGESPLAKAKDWIVVTDPKTGKKGKRETNTMPQWAGSCWYYLRFIDPKNNKRPWDPALEKTWMNVDLYVGGAEHAVLHLLYARFWHKVLFDRGEVSTVEPFQRLFNQGMIVASAYKNRRGSLIPVDEVEEKPDGTCIQIKTGETVERVIAKMSKSLKNVINPDDIIKMYGTDTLRTYLMFMGPLDQSKVWDSKAITGNHRFLKRAWTLITENKDSGTRNFVSDAEEALEVKRELARAVKRVGDDIDSLHFNTAIAALMEFVNNVSGQAISKKTAETFALLVSPLAPHIGEELWERLGHSKSLAYEAWPQADESLLENKTVTVVIQVQGKKRAMIDVAPSISDEALQAAVIAKMATTEYKVTQSNKFITVRSKETNIPKLVNVV